MVPGGSTFSVDITDIALPHDYGVAKKDGRVIFVPGAVVGDRVTITIPRESKKFAYGEIVAIDTPSPFRVTPSCPHFGVCGGCIMQHLRYDKQLEIKKRYLAENLRRIGGIYLDDIEGLAVTPSPDAYSYRNKLELSFGDLGREVILGLRERVSPFTPYKALVASVRQCPVFGAAAEKIPPFFTEFAHKEGLMAFNPCMKKGFLKHLILRESKSTGNVMVILETRPGLLPEPAHLMRELVTQIPQVTSVYHTINTRMDDVVQFDRASHLFGDKSIDEKIAGVNVRIYPGTFSQPNTGCAALLYDTIGEQAGLRGNETILGLFCGSGPIEIFLSRKVARVIGVDVNPTNISAAKENCRLNDVDNCTFYQSRAEDIFKQRHIQRTDVLVLDPPRTGLSKQGIRVVQGLNIQKIAYVSCNPATLARDLRSLLGHGYVIHRITPFDFFPHTGHLETLTILERS